MKQGEELAQGQEPVVPPLQLVLICLMQPFALLSTDANALHLHIMHIVLCMRGRWEVSDVTDLLTWSVTT